MTIDREQFKALAGELRDVQAANKDNVAKVLLRAEDKGIDSAGLRRFVAWQRQDAEKRGQREAIDQQCRYLAGERDTPAELPIGCELARVLNCLRRNMTVRQMAEELGMSTGKVGKLRQIAQMFDVHVHGRVDKRRPVTKVQVITPPEAAALPAVPNHDPETGEIIDDTPPPISKAVDGLEVAPEAWAFVISVRDAHEARLEAEHQQRLAEAQRRKQEAIDEAKRLAEENRRIDADPLDIPQFLRRAEQVPA